MFQSLKRVSVFFPGWNFITIDLQTDSKQLFSVVSWFSCHIKLARFPVRYDSSLA